ncbi:MAG: MFS transporter [Chloroflexi bacterium]|nr:MAG: MFS transporter [Chloroflexota bacterium]
MTSGTAPVDARADETPAHGWRTFLIVWSTQTFSVLGSSLTTFALTVWLTQSLYPGAGQESQLSTALSLLGLAAGVPLLAVAPIAGTWVDRHDRRRTMIAANFGSGAACLVLAAAIATGHLQPWSMVVLAALLAMCASFHGSAFDASYRMLVPAPRLGRANGMMQMVWSISNIVSPGIAALLISLPALAARGLVGGPAGAALRRVHDGAALAIGVDALTFLVMASVLLALAIPSPRRTDLGASGRPAPSFRADMLAGLTFIWRRRALLWLLAAFTLANFISSARIVLLPLIVRFNLAADSSARGFTFQAALAFLTTALSVGGVTGGVLVSAWGGLKRRRIYGVLVPMAISGTAQTIYGLSPWLALTAAMALTFSLMIPVLNAHSQTIWQTKTPREMQGRVFSVRRVLAQGTGPLGLIVAGLLGGALNPGLVMAGMGVALALFCLVQLFNPALRHLEDA